MTHGMLVSVRTGRPRELARPDWDHAPHRTWRTAYRKDEVSGPVRITALGLEGDEQYDRRSHGGPHRAVLAYAASHYPLWRAEPGLESIGPGGFAENLTIEGLDERTVCLGDVYEVGEARLQVSQPRGPCANIARIWNRRDLVERTTATARTGWYHRVLREGWVARGDTVALVERAHPEWPVERAFRVHARDDSDRDALRALAACAALSPGWRERLAARAERR